MRKAATGSTGTTKMMTATSGRVEMISPTVPPTKWFQSRREERISEAWTRDSLAALMSATPPRR